MGRGLVEGFRVRMSRGATGDGCPNTKPKPGFSCLRRARSVLASASRRRPSDVSSTITVQEKWWNVSQRFPHQR